MINKVTKELILEGLNCTNFAMKSEAKVNKISQVQSCSRF